MRRLFALVFVAFTFSCLCPAQMQPAPTASDYIEMTGRLGSQVKWFANDPTILLEGRNRAAVAASKKANKDFNRAAALDRALVEAGKKKRLVLYYAPRILAGARGRQAYRPAILDHYMMSVHFSDPECVELINRMFVPVRLTCDAEIGKKLGIEAPELLEPAVFFVNPDGQVVRGIDSFRSFNSAWFDSLLCAVLNDNKTFAGPSLPTRKAATQRDQSPKAQLHYARNCLHDGNATATADALAALLEKKELAKEVRAEATLLHARHLRRFGQLDEAASFLGAAVETVPAFKSPSKPRNPNPFADSYYCEMGRTLLLMRNTQDAAAAFSKVQSGSHRAEAQYYLGICDFFDGREDSALRRWKDAAASDRDSAYAWRAAANLIDGEDRTPVGAMRHGFEDPFGQPAPTASADSTSRPQSLEMTGKIGRDAVDFLLRMQRANGSWPDSRYAYWGAPDYTPNVWIATTALAAAALLDWRDMNPEAVDAALIRAETYMFDRRRMAFNLNEEVYAHAYRLVYLAKRIDSSQDDAAKNKAVERMNEVVKDLAGIQVRAEGRRAAADGAFSHEYPNAFTTAAALNALHLARERGAKVPRKMFVGGAKALPLRHGTTTAPTLTPTAGRSTTDRKPVRTVLRTRWAGRLSPRRL